jgi:hypothetical protein
MNLWGTIAADAGRVLAGVLMVLALSSVSSAVRWCIPVRR